MFQSISTTFPRPAFWGMNSCASPKKIASRKSRRSHKVVTWRERKHAVDRATDLDHDVVELFLRNDSVRNREQCARYGFHFLERKVEDSLQPPQSLEGFDV